MTCASEYIRNAMTNPIQPMNQLEIRTAVKKKFNVDLNNGTVSNQLQKLSKENQIKRVGHCRYIWLCDEGAAQ